MGLFHNIFGTPLTTPNSVTTSTRRTGAASGRETVTLTKGEVVKGEVTDLRSNEVTVRLEDGRTLHAKLSSAAELSIGQESEFLVQDSDENLITLKILSDGDPSFTESAIDKALEAAGFPKSQNAVSIVRSLLTAGLPANKEMIKKMMQYSAANKGVEHSTLTALLKNEIPVTKTNASQLQAYRNFEHRLLSQASTLTSSLVSALQFGEATPEFTAKLLATFFSEDAASAEASAGNPSTAADPSAVSDMPANTSALSADSAAFGSVTKEALSLQDAAQFEELLHQADSSGNRLSALTDSVEQMLSESTALSSPEGNTGNSAALSDTGLPLANLLPGSENEQLQRIVADLASQNPDNPQFAALQASPDFSAKQLFSALAAHGQEKPEALSALFKKEPALSDLLEKTLLSDFVMQPEDLEKEDAVKKFYEELNRTLSKMTELTKDAGTSQALKTAADTAGKMQENINFMNTLNQIFPYVQLPLKMTEQLTHGELYVYSKKKDLSAENKEVSILLHLDMDSLGPTDVHVSLFRQAVNAQFYLPDEESQKVVSDHLSELTDALSKKGFTLTASVTKREKEPDIVNDFMNGGEAVPMKRFRFDIRA